MKKNKKKIPFSKNLNRMPIIFENEPMINFFISLLKKVNETTLTDYLEPFKMTKRELWNEIFPNDKYRESEILEIVKILTKSDNFKIKNGGSIHGSMFIIEEIEQCMREPYLNIEIPKLFQKHLFFKNDREILLKVKKKEKLTVRELDYWDRELKEKKEQLFLINEAATRGIRGKYAKRLYMLLEQFAETGYFTMGIDEFREVMGVPSVYPLGKMNADIIKRAKDELKKKGIFKFPDESKGSGRRKIEKIEIKFSVIKNEKETKKVENSGGIIEGGSTEENPIEITPEIEAVAVSEMEAMGITLASLKKGSGIYYSTIRKYLKSKQKK